MKRGARLGLNKLKVNVRSNGQVSVTIPKQLAQALHLDSKCVVSFQMVNDCEAKILVVER